MREWWKGIKDTVVAVISVLGIGFVVISLGSMAINSFSDDTPERVRVEGVEVKLPNNLVVDCVVSVDSLSCDWPGRIVNE